MKLDLNAYDESFFAAFRALDGRLRVSYCCAAGARYLPLYKAYRVGTDWKALEPVLKEGEAFVRGKKAKTPKRLWDGVGDLVSHYYEEGQPLLVYGVSAGTDVLQAITDHNTDYSAVSAARCARLSTLVGEEVDATLADEGIALHESAVAEETRWRASTLAALAQGPLPSPTVDLDDPATLPGWWDALKQCKTPVRRRSLKD